jgi:Domain of unknown function (DUF929)
MNQGKPELLYIGAAFCPYCATNQWAMIVALSRFGSFSNLQFSHSAPSPEDYPSTATLSFFESTYSSKYISFLPIENLTVNKTLLQPITEQEQAIWNQYVPEKHQYYPFLDIGNSYVVAPSGGIDSLFNPQVLQGQDQRQIAASLNELSSSVAQAVDGSANLLTAAICHVTNYQPRSVCNSQAITTAQGDL